MAMDEQPVISISVSMDVSVFIGGLFIGRFCPRSTLIAPEL